jgi:hypothetical protein
MTSDTTTLTKEMLQRAIDRARLGPDKPHVFVYPPYLFPEVIRMLERRKP